MFKSKYHRIRYHPTSIAIQGQLGSFSHEAVTYLFPEFNEAAVYCSDTFEEPFERVRNGFSDIAVIPIENTIAGNVPYVFNLLRRNKLSIIGEFHLGVQFHLLTLPNANAVDIEEVHSHMHALAQSQDYIDRHPRWTTIRNPDTAGAAKMVSELGDKTKASISSAFAAQRYGLKMADRHIQDAKDPITRFWVFHIDEMIPDIKDKDGRPPRHRFVSNLYFKPHRNIDRPLTRVLELFSKHLGDRAEPVIERYKGNDFRHEGFLAEFMGYYDEKKVKRLWDELDKICSKAVGFGCYEVHHFHRFQHRAGVRDPNGKYQYG